MIPIFWFISGLKKSQFVFIATILTGEGILSLEKLMKVFIALEKALICKMEKIIPMKIKKESSCNLIYLQNYSI